MPCGPGAALDDRLTDPGQLATPSNHLEALSGDREGQHSIWINRQYRICFAWREGHACEVEIVDFGNGTELWLNMQARYDRWMVEHDPRALREAERVEPVHA